ncbi:hypothetical protein C8J56DRAFT_1162513 [Mycena floridula]|nr:hypothetical protein C8J56DRAFT_1162513 [Mycena floridula]
MAIVLSCPNCHHNLANLANIPARPARLDALLASNEIPSAADISALADFAAGAAQAANELQNTISQVEEILALLEEARKKVIHLAEECRTIRDPVRRLPQEVLSEIFLEASIIQRDVWQAAACIDPKTRLPPLSSLDRRAAPWTLTHVARRWRITALTDPKIWSSIAVSVHYKSGLKDQQYNLTTLALQLQRSANHKLDIYFDTDLGYKDFLIHGTHVLSLLLSSSTRWERLFYWANFTNVLVSLEGFLPALRVLYLRTNWTSSSTVAQSSIHLPVFRDCPKLHAVVCGPNTILHFQMPLNQIEEWDAVGRYDNRASNRPGTTLVALKRLTGLRICRLDVLERSDDPIPQGLVHLPELRHFDLKGSAAVDIVIAHITVPKLKDLRILGEIDVKGVVSFIQRSQISLETFEFSSSSAHDGQVLDILQQLPQLQSLNLRTQSAYTVIFFRSLSERDSQSGVPTLLPVLRKLTLRGQVSNMHCLQAFMDLGLSRREINVELER